MKIFKSLSFISCFLIIASCSSDDDHNLIQVDNNTENIKISAFKTTSFTEYVDNTNSFNEVLDGEIKNNKYFAYTKETFWNDEPQSSTSSQNYFYANESVVKIISEYNEDDIKHFTYSDEGNTIDIFWEVNNKNYRLAFISENIGHFEVLDDSGNVLQRIIALYDENDNIIETKTENLKTGTFQNPNYFTYTENNLTAINLRNGESMSISYTNIKNTRTFLNDNSIHKKLGRLICAQVLNGTGMQGIQRLDLSTHISTTDASKYSYEVAENGYFEKRTLVEDYSYDNTGGTDTRTMEFIFE